MCVEGVGTSAHGHRTACMFLSHTAHAASDMLARETFARVAGQQAGAKRVDRHQFAASALDQMTPRGQHGLVELQPWEQTF